MDFTNSLIVSIHLGQAKIQTGNFKIIHAIDLDEYEKITLHLLSTMNIDIYKKHHLYPYISHELDQIQNLIENLRPRKSKRSLDFIGSAWKWVAGNPDHEDFITIKEKVTNVLENNNRQVVINNLITERINNLTEVNNNLINLVKSDLEINNKMALDLSYKVKLLKEDLQNVNYAIHWAKAGIINSLILSRQEIKLALDTFRKENLPFTTAEEALNFSEIKIISNHNSFLYIVNIPITDYKIYDKIILKPVKRTKIATEVLHDKIIKTDNEMYALKQDCKTSNFISVCKFENLINISNTSCIPKILKSLAAKCNATNTQHIPTVEEISPGIILLNNFNGTILIDTLPQTLNGTFLIKFDNLTLNIEGRPFVSKSKSKFQVLPAILHPLPNEEDLKKILSLEMLNELHINNTETLELLQTESNINKFSSYTLIAITSLMFLAITYLCRKHGNTKIIIENEKISQKPQLAEATQSTPNPEPPSSSKQKLNDIPYF